MDMNLIQEIDQTIEEICKYIKDETKKNTADIGKISEITNALAALIIARANANIVENKLN